MAKKVKEIKTENNRTTPSPAIVALIKENAKFNEVLRYGNGETELAIEILHSVPVGVKAEAIKMSTDLLFQDGATDVSGFMPAYREFAKRYGVLIAHTDLALPTDLALAWETLLYTPIYNDVVRILGEEAVADFVNNFNELVEARKQEIIHSINWNKILDKIMGKLEKTPEVINELIKGVNLKDLDLENIVEIFKGVQGAEGLDFGGLVQAFQKNK